MLKFVEPKVKVVQCRNPALWYANRIGEVFELSHAVPNALWVKVDGRIDWIYTGDYDLAGVTGEQ